MSIIHNSPRLETTQIPTNPMHKLVYLCIYPQTTMPNRKRTNYCYMHPVDKSHKNNVAPHAQNKTHTKATHSCMIQLHKTEKQAQLSMWMAIRTASGYLWLGQGRSGTGRRCEEGLRSEQHYSSCSSGRWGYARLHLVNIIKLNTFSVYISIYRSFPKKFLKIYVAFF